MMKKKRIIYISLASVFVAAILYFIIGSFYRISIPDLADTDQLPGFLESQIRSASRKAMIRPSARNIGILGMIYHSGGFNERASDCYNLALRKDSSEWIWSYYLGCLNREMGESEKAAENFRDVIKYNPDAYHAWYYLGDIYQDLGQNDRAEDALSRISSLYQLKVPTNQVVRIDHFPIGTYASYLLAKSRISTGKGDPPELILRDLLVHSPNFGPAYRLLGSISRARGEQEAAEKYVCRANDNLYSTTPADTLLDLISLRSRSDLFILKQIDEADYNYYYDWALSLANHALQYTPDNQYLLSRTIKILLKTDKGSNALIFLDDYLNTVKDDFDEIKQVADLLYENNFYEQSGAYYYRALELHPENAEVQANIILGLLGEGKEQQALSFLDDCLDVYGNDQQVITNAVYLMLLLNNDEKVEYYLQKLRVLSPSGTKMLLLSGYIAQQKGEIDKARQFFEKSFENDDRELLAAQVLGDILMRQKNWEMAISHYRQALEYFPNDPSLIEKLGSLLVMCPDNSLRNYQEGIEYLERLLVHRTCPPDMKLFAGRSLAHAFKDLGDKSRVVSYANYTINIAQVYGFSSSEIIDEMHAMLQEQNL